MPLGVSQFLHRVSRQTRRPAGLLVTLVVVVVVVVFGGNNFYTWALPETMFGLEKIKSRTPYILSLFVLFFQKPMYGFDANVWSRRGGHTLFRNRCGRLKS